MDMETKQRFVGGSPVSATDNPFSKAAGIDAQDILPSLDVEGRERAVLDDLDAYGSDPVVSDAAAERPANPPSSDGSAG